MSNTGGAAQGSWSAAVPRAFPSLILAGALSIVPTTGTTLNVTGNISEMAMGGGRLSLDGPGTLILGGSDGSYTGGTSVTAGTLIATSSSSLAGWTNLTVAAGGTFLFDPSVTAAPATGGGAHSSGLAHRPRSGGAGTGHAGPLGSGAHRGHRHYLGAGPLTIGLAASSANNTTPGLLPGTGAGTANATPVYAWAWSWSRMPIITRAAHFSRAAP